MHAPCTFSEGVMPDTEPGQSLHGATKTLSYACGGKFQLASSVANPEVKVS